MLSDRSREALDDLLVTWSWSNAPAPPSSRPDAELLQALDDPPEAIVTWLCDERQLPAAMAEAIVSAQRRVSKR